MKIGIIEAGVPPAALLAEHGTYDAMTRRLVGARHAYATFRAFDGHLPPAGHGCGAFVVTGSAAGVKDGLPWVDALIAFLRETRGKAKLVGICFGHQVMAQAFGGDVAKAPRGWGLGLHRYTSASEPRGWTTPPPSAAPPRTRTRCSCRRRAAPCAAPAISRRTRSSTTATIRRCRFSSIRNSRPTSRGPCSRRDACLVSGPSTPQLRAPLSPKETTTHAWRAGSTAFYRLEPVPLKLSIAPCARLQLQHCSRQLTSSRNRLGSIATFTLRDMTMPTVRIREFKQRMFTSLGVCYFACDYMINNANSCWKNSTSFAAARQATTRMSLIGMMNYAKVMERRKADQDVGYNDIPPLQSNSLYKIEMQVTTPNNKKLDHEVLALTGTDELLLFDVNYGVFHITATLPKEFHTAIEAELTTLHAPVGIAGKFGYKRARRAFS